MEIEYASMSKEEAQAEVEKYKYLTGAEITHSENKERYIVTAILVAPSAADKLREFIMLVSQCDIGLKTAADLKQFNDNYTGEDYTAVLFGRKVSSPPGHLALPLQHLVNQNGELETGFGF